MNDNLGHKKWEVIEWLHLVNGSWLCELSLLCRKETNHGTCFAFYCTCKVPSNPAQPALLFAAFVISVYGIRQTMESVRLTVWVSVNETQLWQGGIVSQCKLSSISESHFHRHYLCITRERLSALLKTNEFISCWGGWLCEMGRW